MCFNVVFVLLFPNWLSSFYFLSFYAFPGGCKDTNVALKGYLVLKLLYMLWVEILSCISRCSAHRSSVLELAMEMSFYDFFFFSPKWCKI